MNEDITPENKGALLNTEMTNTSWWKGIPTVEKFSTEVSDAAMKVENTNWNDSNSSRQLPLQKIESRGKTNVNIEDR